MNKPHRFEPVAPLLIADGTSLHESTRTAMSTNFEACGARSLSIATSRMEMRVNAGALEVRFRHQVMNGPARQPAVRARRAPFRR